MYKNYTLSKNMYTKSLFYIHIKKLIIAMGLFSFLFACKKEVNPLKLTGFTKYTISQGSHSSSPIFIKPLSGDCTISGEAYFTEDSFYDLGTIDQLDWNKLDGFKLDYNPVPNHAAMIGWRALDSVIEVGPYFNNKGIVFPDTNEILRIPPFEIFYYTISLRGKVATVSITYNGTTITKSQVLRSAFLYTRVSFWFGGNRTAPNKVECFIKR